MSSRSSSSKRLCSYSAVIAVVLLAVLISLSPAQGFHLPVANPVAFRRSAGLLRSSPISDMEGWLSRSGVNIDLARHSSFEDGTPNASVRGLKMMGGGNSSSPIVNLPRKLTLSSSKEEGWDKDLATQLLREVAKGGRGEFSGEKGAGLVYHVRNSSGVAPSQLVASLLVLPQSNSNSFRSL